MDQLTQTLKELTVKAGGTWGIVIEDLGGEEAWSFNEQEAFYAASVIKLPIMAAVFAQADRQQLKLSDRLTFHREDIVGGAGVLQHMSPGIQLPIYDLVTLMIIQSDNTATNMLIDLVGSESIQQTMRELGMSNSAFYNKLMTVPVNTEGRNTITARDVSCLLKEFATGAYISHHACQQMVAIMKKQQIRNGLPAYLPHHHTDIVGVEPEWELAHKTGSYSGIHHDVGVMYVGQRSVIISALSKDVNPIVSAQTLAEIGKAIYDYVTHNEIDFP